jgi:hypothetical protein
MRFASKALKVLTTNPMVVGVATSIITTAGASIDFGKEERVAANKEQKRHNY